MYITLLTFNSQNGQLIVPYLFVVPRVSAIYFFKIKPLVRIKVWKINELQPFAADPCCPVQFRLDIKGLSLLVFISKAGRILHVLASMLQKWVAYIQSGNTVVILAVVKAACSVSWTGHGSKLRTARSVRHKYRLRRTPVPRRWSGKAR